MRLRGVRVGRLPGIDAAFELDAVEAGVNVVVGPNGSGKSQLRRALRETLWPGASPSGAEVVSFWCRDATATELRAELGRGVRWQADGADVPAPTLPDSHLAGCYSVELRDLLAPDSSTDRELANRIRIQMAGGYDLRAVAGGAQVRPKLGTGEADKLDKARAALRRLEADRRGLASEDDRLDALARELDAAREARRTLEMLYAARDRVGARQEAEKAARRIAALPPQLSQLQGGELDRLEEVHGELASIEAEDVSAAERIRSAEKMMLGLGLRKGPVDSVRLATWQERARELRERMVRLEGAERREKSAEAELSHALGALGGEVEAKALSGADLDSLHEWVSRAIRIKEARDGLLARIEGLSADCETAASSEPASSDVLQSVAEALREWLASPQPGVALEPRRRLRIVSIASALVLAVAAVGLVLWSAPWPALAVALLSGVAAGLAARSWSGSASADERVIYERHVLELADEGVKAPETWTREAVRAHLRGIDGRLREALAVGERLAFLESLRLQERALAKKADALAAERARFGAELGIDPGATELRVADLHTRIATWRDAQRERNVAVTERAHERQESDGIFAQLSAFLVEEADRKPDDVASAQSALDDLADRCGRWRKEQDSVEQAGEDRLRLAARRQVLQSRREALLREAGCDPEDPEGARRVLERLLPELDAYRALVNQRRVQATLVEDLTLRLASHSDLADLDAGEIQARIAEAERRANREGEIAAEKATIEEKIRSAASSEALGDAMAGVAKSEQALMDRREELLDATMTSLLLEEIEDEYREATQPAVLRSAAELFATFTHNRYALKLHDDPAGSQFRAVDTKTGAGLALEELSDGTRMQLLIAARIAFASHAERGEPLPLFLDEALSASDPERFRAVAACLIALAREGRQIFYLTCNPSDVALFAQVCEEAGAPSPGVINLAEVRRLAAAHRFRAAPKLPARPSPPSSAGCTPDEYALRLGAEPLDPYAPVDAVHLIHLLRDDLELLEQLVARARVAHVGAWRSLTRAGASPAVVTDEEAERVDGWVVVAETLLDAWRIGRGRPAYREALIRSRAVSDSYLDACTELLAELGGDAEGLLEVLAARSDARVKGFRANQVAALRDFFEAEGFLSDQRPLGDDEIRASVLARLRSHAGWARLGPELVTQRVDELLALLQGGAPSASRLAATARS